MKKKLDEMPKDDLRIQAYLPKKLVEQTEKDIYEVMFKRAFELIKRVFLL